MHSCKHCGKLFYKFQLLKMHSFDVHKDIMPNTKVSTYVHAIYSHEPVVTAVME